MTTDDKDARAMARLREMQAAGFYVNLFNVADERPGWIALLNEEQALEAADPADAILGLEWEGKSNA